MTVEHQETGPGRHWFEHFDDGGESWGHADVHERPDHAWVESMHVSPHMRGRGIGTALLDSVQRHFAPKPVRLKPYPVGERKDDPDEEQLREFYSNRGFTDYQRKPGDSFEASEWMERTAAAAPLRNPHTKGLEWYHGTKASGQQLADGFREPRYHADLERQFPVAHWNALLGVHFAAHHRSAEKFTGDSAGGLSDPRAWREHNQTPSVVHARLHITNPKIYPSEEAMDHEAYEREHGQRKNYIDNYLSKASDYDDHSHNTWEFEGDSKSTIPRHEEEDYEDWEGDDPPAPVLRRTLWLNAHPDKEGIASRFKQHLMDQGHDGIVYSNGFEHERVRSSRPESNLAAIAFHPSQIEVTKHHLPGDEKRTAAARWAPSSGIFGPTTGFDSRLFGSDHRMRGEVAEDIMGRLDGVLHPLDPGWQDWTRVYLAGGSASEWAGDRPNDTAQDLDVLVGVSFGRARERVAAFATLSDEQIAQALNGIFRANFNATGWQAFGGTWDVTAYVNLNGWDITALHPYAAYDISNGAWAVRPPHLPGHSLADFHPAQLAQARAVLAEARAILRLPEPQRTWEAQGLWERVHADRSHAFSAEGEGWLGQGNVIEKWLAYEPHGVWAKIRQLALAKTATLGSDASQLGKLYHSTPYAHGFPHDDWMHLGTRDAAEDRARQIRPHEYGLPSDTPVTMHTVHLRGRVYPHVLTDDQATSLTDSGFPVRKIDVGLPSGEGYHIFPYHNEGEDPGSISYLAHRSAIVPVRTETFPRSHFLRREASGSDGDDYFTCSKGHEHWGQHGAAGLLVRHRRGDGRWQYLLQKRSSDGETDHPGVWSIPGGAIGQDETPEAGARREAREELGPLPRELRHHHTVKSTDCGDWAYHTVVMDAPEHFIPRGGGETEHETAGTAWHTAGEIEDLRQAGQLHPAFAKSWDTVRRSRGPVTAAIAQRKYYEGTADIKDVVPQHGTEPERVGDWEKQGHWPPIKTRWGGGRTFAIVNGHHRYDAARNRNMSQVQVHVTSAFGVPANLRNPREITEHEYNNGLTTMDDFRDRNGPKEAARSNPHELVDVYHASDPAGAYRVANGEHDKPLFVSTHDGPYIDQFGQARVHLRVPRHMLRRDPAEYLERASNWAGPLFVPGEKHYVIKSPIRLEHVVNASGADRKTAATGYDISPSSGMIYLDIPDGLVQQVPGAVDDHHITVVYLGKNLSQEDFALACKRAAAAAVSTAPLSGVLAGRDTFPPSESSDGKIPVFVPAYIPGIGALRRQLEDLSASEHPHYRPHLTLGYYSKDEKLPPAHPPIPVTFGRLHVKRGDDVASFPFGG